MSTHAYIENHLVEQPAKALPLWPQPSPRGGVYDGLFAELGWATQNPRRTRDLLLPRLLSGPVEL